MRPSHARHASQPQSQPQHSSPQPGLRERRQRLYDLVMKMLPEAEKPHFPQIYEFFRQQHLEDRKLSPQDLNSRFSRELSDVIFKIEQLVFLDEALSS